MPKSYKLKLISGGASGSGKTSFIHGTLINETPIGVSFKAIECFVNEGDSWKFVVWDLKARDQFKFLFPTFCRGAAGAFLFFDVSNYNSFKELNYWINIFRRNAGNIPIILIGTKIDLNSREVPDEVIQKLIEEQHLEGVFYTSIHDNEEKKEMIFRFLIGKLDPNTPINDFSIFLPTQIEDEIFEKFLKYFSSCPICKKENHFEYLRTFYYSKNYGLIKLKEKLLELIDESEYFDKYYNKIDVGIPCCHCFKKIFGKN